MWTLIIFTVLHSSVYNGGLGSTTVPGYTSRANCEKAGMELVTNAVDTRYYYKDIRQGKS